MFTEAEIVNHSNETEQDDSNPIKPIEPLVIFDAASYPDSQELINVSKNLEGINFDSRSQIDLNTAPINVPDHLKKHWALVISLREQLETN